MRNNVERSQVGISTRLNDRIARYQLVKKPSKGNREQNNISTNLQQTVQGNKSNFRLLYIRYPAEYFTGYPIFVLASRPES